jgi:hypothetical protein
MTKKIHREINRFEAASEDGDIYTVIVRQEFILAEEYEKPTEEIPGLKDLITTDGVSLHFINDNQFQIAQTGEILTKI